MSEPHKTKKYCDNCGEETTHTVAPYKVTGWSEECDVCGKTEYYG